MVPSARSARGEGTGATSTLATAPASDDGEGDAETGVKLDVAGMATGGDTLEASFFHIMAISTDNGEGAGMNTSCINGACDCVPAPLCCENACASGGSTCNGFDCSDLPITECDREWGAGQIYSADGQSCAIDDDRRFMLHTQTELTATFGCAANVGVYGAGAEKPMLAMGHALSDELNGAGGCNQGFLRDDAILVVTVITAEEDDNTDPNLPGSPGDPPDWIDALVQAKGGNPDAVVFLALVGDSNLPDGECAPGGMPNTGGAEAAPRLQAVANGFPFGYHSRTMSAVAGGASGGWRRTV